MSRVYSRLNFFALNSRSRELEELFEFVGGEFGAELAAVEPVPALLRRDANDVTNAMNIICSRIAR